MHFLSLKFNKKYAIKRILDKNWIRVYHKITGYIRFDLSNTFYTFYPYIKLNILWKMPSSVHSVNCWKMSLSPPKSCIYYFFLFYALRARALDILSIVFYMCHRNQCSTPWFKNYCVSYYIYYYNFTRCKWYRIKIC